MNTGMNISTVVDYDDILYVNDMYWVPKDSRNKMYKEVLVWLETNELDSRWVLSEEKEKALAKNESHTTSVILKVMPAYRQRNYMARMIELQDHKMEGTFDGEMTIEYEAMRGMWDFVKGERHRCKMMEKAIGECNTLEELEALGI